jgi:hypothetical protein
MDEGESFTGSLVVRKKVNLQDPQNRIVNKADLITRSKIQNVLNNFHVRGIVK